MQDGATVEVRSAPQTPAMTARMNTFGAIRGGVLAIGVMGAVFFLGGVGHLWPGGRGWRSGRLPVAR
ncbi:hypothetical protein WL74_24670 [Burkholderia cepacia]|nr:hypothetical protein WL00_29500 [Burkholderia cepacia]KVX72684.1 hypothetical protein WL07_13120 [Burkholderia cepacia]KWE19078.1 hypothetical protein WL74_24670 [Burkholderia cepacia]